MLDAVFGAGTFMLCMGLGIAYSRKENANKLIRRGCVIFVLAYVLNFVRDFLPRLVLIPSGIRTAESLTDGFLCVDIMMFAGLALLLFGLLKKAKVSDLWLLIISLAMSAVGSFVRFIDCGSTLWNELAGLFIGMAFATGLYHFISLPFSDRPKRIVTRISSNINRIYCIHWILVCWISYVFEVFYYDGMQDGMTVVTAIIIFAVSVLLAEFYTRCRENKRLKKNP